MTNMRRSPKKRVMAFYDTSRKRINCVVRQEHGTDIDAACGQLRSNTMKRDRQKRRRSGKSIKWLKRELILRLGVAIYSLYVCLFCFTPSLNFHRVETPGIQTLDAWFSFDSLNSFGIWVKWLVLDKPLIFATVF